MITTRDIKELGFEFNDRFGSCEEWLMEFEKCNLAVNFYDYGKTVELTIYQSGYTAEIQLKGEVTLERIKKLIEALR